MLGPSVEKLFERYRRRGDAAALARVFDQTAPELFRLAQHLVRDPLGAEDVLQDTFVAAIDAAERWDADRPLVPWLTGILARKASETRRRARRTLEVDRLHERAQVDPAEAVAESELSVEIVQAIEALPELYRAVLLRHLFDGARPAEIARDLGRAPGTVRMQIHRGLEQLRKSLPAGFAAGAALAAFSPRGLAAVREAVLTHAATVAAAGGVAAVTGTAKVATFALGKLLGGGALAVLVVVAAAIAWRLQVAPTGEPAAPSRLESAERTRPRTDLAPVASTTEARTAGATPSSVREPRVLLVGTVAGVAPDELAATVVEVRGVARYRWDEQHTLRTHPATDGRFEIALDPIIALGAQRGALSAIAVRAVHQAYLADGALIDIASATPAVAREPEEVAFELTCALDLRPAALVRGEVRDARGPRAGVQVVLARVLDAQPQRPEVDRVLSDAEGRFVLQAGEPGEYGVLALEPGFLPAFAPVGVRAAHPVDVPALVLEEGRTLRGRITDGGRPVPGAEVTCSKPGLRDAGQRTPMVPGRAPWIDWTATTDGDGRFELRGLAWEPLWLDVVHAGPGVRFLGPGPQARLEAQDETVDLELRAARLVLDLVDVDGTALAGELVWPVPLDAAGLRGPASVAAPVGHLEIAVASGLELALELRSPACEPVRLTVGPLEPGGLRRETVVLEPDAGRGALRLACSSPGSRLEYVSARFGPAPEATRRVELAGGSVLLGDLPTGAVALELHANGAWRHYEDLLLPTRLELVLEAAPWSLPARSLAFERGGRLRLAVKDLAGQLLPARCTLRDLYGVEQQVRFLLRSPDQQGFATGERLSDRGPNDVYPNLAPGVYEVELSLEGRQTRVLAVRVTRGEVTELEVVLP